MISAKNLDTPDDVRKTDRGRMDVVTLDGATIVRGTYQPGWRWTTDIKPMARTDSCQIPHTGVVLAGRFGVRTDDGQQIELGPGDAHTVAPGHDAWVIGDEPVTVLDISLSQGGLRGSCPCGVEFRVRTEEERDHLVAAMQQHAAGSHGQDLTRDETLEAVSRS